MKLLIIGHGRHGKDTVAELLVERLPSLSFKSSSLFAAETVVRPAMEAIGIDYPSLEACYEDRINHRDFWKQAIADFCQPPERLALAILAENDIYVGMRTRREFEASKHLFDHIVWVDRSTKLPDDPTCELNMYDADSCIDNNFSMQHLRREVVGFGEYIRQRITMENSRDQSNNPAGDQL